MNETCFWGLEKSAMGGMCMDYCGCIEGLLALAEILVKGIMPCGALKNE